jgi:hypothetical protein
VLITTIESNLEGDVIICGKLGLKKLGALPEF